MEPTQIIIGLMIIFAGVISLEFGISVAIVEVIAGIIARNILPPVHAPWMEFLANFGLLGIMLFAGFEADAHLLKKYYKKSLYIGSFAYFIPFIILFLTSFYLLNLSTRVSLLVAIGLSTTSLALVYFVLKDYPIVDKKGSNIILTSAMVVDILSMFSLSILFEGFTLTSFFVILFLIASFFVLPKFGKWLFSRYHKDSIEFKTRFILIVLLGMAVISEKAGVHAAILAFITGFVFSELIEEHEAVENKLRGVVFALLAPLFFFKAGLSVDLSIVTYEIVGMIVILGTVAFFSKYVSSYFAMRRYFKPEVAKPAGFIFNFRLSFGIVVATVGVTEGIIELPIYMSLILCVILIDIFSSLMIKKFPHEE